MSSRTRLVTLVDYATVERPHTSWVVPALIPCPGMVVLLGPPKIGKSFLALQLALAVAQGRSFLGFPAQPSRVWYLYLDSGEGLWQDRLRRLTEAGYDLSGPVYMVHPDDQPKGFDIRRASAQQWVADVLAQIDPQLVILDVLRKFHSGDENDSTEMKMVSDIMDRLFVGRSLFVIHHTRKIPDGVEQPNVTNLSRGSSFLTGQADAIWLLWSGKIRMESRWDEPVTYAVRQSDTGLWTVVSTNDLTERLLALCAEFPHRTHADLAAVAKERWGISRATYYRHLAGRQCAHSTQQCSIQ